MLTAVYAGSPAVSAKVLDFLLQNQGNDYRIAGVLTNPPSAQGRHKAQVPTEVAALAAQWNETAAQPLAIMQPEHLYAKERELISALQPDILICFAYGHIFGPKFLSLFPLGGINLHPSLLPKHRGATPVQAAILAGDTETGVTVQKLALEADTGDILRQLKIPLDGTETAESLLDKSAESGAQLLLEVLQLCALNRELPPAAPQSGVPSCCSLIAKEDGRIYWNMPTAQIYARLRAFTPWPGSFTTAGGSVLKILEAAPAEAAQGTAGTVLHCDKQHGIIVKTGDGALRLLRLQWQGKNAVAWKDFLNGARNFAGTILGN